MTPDRFTRTVEGVGDFTFRKRTLRDQVWIERDAEKTVGGVLSDAPPHLRSVAIQIAMLDRLTVAAPDGWDLTALDPLDEGDVDRLSLVAGVLRRAEEEFRRPSDPKRPVLGAGA